MSAQPQATERAERHTCEVRDGRFVEPCVTLASVVDNIAPSFNRKKGIARWSLTNTQTFTPSRTYFGVKCAAYPDGFLFNFCPFCGAGINEPFAEKEAAHVE